jgi:hypothetical protein
MAKNKKLSTQSLGEETARAALSIGLNIHHIRSDLIDLVASTTYEAQLKFSDHGFKDVVTRCSEVQKCWGLVVRNRNTEAIEQHLTVLIDGVANIKRTFVDCSAKKLFEANRDGVSSIHCADALWDHIEDISDEEFEAIRNRNNAYVESITNPIIMALDQLMDEESMILRPYYQLGKSLVEARSQLLKLENQAYAPHSCASSQKQFETTFQASIGNDLATRLGGLLSKCNEWIPECQEIRFTGESTTSLRTEIFRFLRKLDSNPFVFEHQRFNSLQGLGKLAPAFATCIQEQKELSNQRIIVILFQLWKLPDNESLDCNCIRNSIRHELANPSLQLTNQTIRSYISSINKHLKDICHTKAAKDNRNLPEDFTPIKNHNRNQGAGQNARWMFDPSIKLLFDSSIQP